MKKRAISIVLFFLSLDMIKAVVFDLDNTLLDFMQMKEQAVKSAIQGMIEAGMDIDPKISRDRIFEIYEEKGWEYQEVFDHFIQEEVGELNYKFLASGIVAYRKAKEASLILYPSVKNTLISLMKSGLKLGVVSDAPSREAWMRICYVNLHHIFDEVVTFDDTKKRKPAPEPFERIIALLDVPAENILMVGDWPERDVFGAKEVGMKTAFAKYGDSFGVVESGADYDLDDLSQLIEIIQNENEK
jgi:putative hydrolase of the HAD superfamily